MGSTRYAALLRGINVGGRNKISMADLRAVFTDAGFVDVATYIQSGNVVFASDKPRGSLETDTETLLARRLESPPVVVVRSHRQLGNLVHDAPDDFTERADGYYRDVVFLKAPLTCDAAMRVVQLRDGVDDVWQGPGVLYFSRVSAERSKSRMSRIVGTPEYRLMTIRSWATTTKLLALLDTVRAR